MKSLLILRHAKSSWKYAELPDHDRPLNKRGKRDAPMMGRLLRQRKLIPDLIISSTAARAMDTALTVARLVGYKKEIMFCASLYGAGPGAYLKAIASLTKEQDHDCSLILIVGHNPGVEELVQMLTREFQEMPTCALAVITLPIETWSSLQRHIGQGKVTALWRPRELT